MLVRAAVFALNQGRPRAVLRPTDAFARPPMAPRPTPRGAAGRHGSVRLLTALPGLAQPFVLLLVGLLAPATAAEPDLERGALVWSGQCAMCHQIGPGAGHGVGPALDGVVGQPIGARESFTGYSPGFVMAGLEGAVWDEAALRDFLADPYGTHPDTRMGFGGLHSAQDLDNLMAWLVPASRGELTPPTGFRVDPQLLAEPGDAEFGEFLSGECTTCHRRDGGADGIPSITGWPEDGFVTVMHAYREKVRPNVTMQTIAARLDDEEIAALAAYFATLPRGAD